MGDSTTSEIVKSILKFIREEMDGTALDPDQKESLDVAKQCLESTYEVDGNNPAVLANAADLRRLFRADSEVSEEHVRLAEDLKVRGNDQMKLGLYADALENYTKAIGVNPKNHVYYCNRAAAYSRLEKHWDAISDCKESIKISPTAKAYGRMGVAYSNMHMYKEAKEAYAKAHELDPANGTYEQNLRLAEELMASPGARPASGGTQSSSGGGGGGGGGGPMPGMPGFDFNTFMSNPALLNMASQMLNDPSFRYMVSGLMSPGPNGDPNIDAFVTAGQQLAQQMQAANPHLLETLRASMGGGRGPDGPDGAEEPGEDARNENN